jgi:C1A family cysteine protease
MNSGSNLMHGKGYLPDVPRAEDPSYSSASIAKVISRTRFGKMVAGPHTKMALPTTIDLRGIFPAVLDQGMLGSCTANAAAGMIDYFELVANGSYLDPSRLFIYKVTRDLMGAVGDSGAFLRTTAETLQLFGAPPEYIWPYNGAAAGFNQLFDQEPSAFCYAYGRNYAAVQPFRLDPNNIQTPDLLVNIKAALAGGLPAMFGFPTYEEFDYSTGDIPYPSAGHQTTGSHAILAVGYDDDHSIKGLKGALIVRNSWGPSWGINGYAYMSYEYVLTGLAVDWWTMVRQDWLDSGKFD